MEHVAITFVVGFICAAIFFLWAVVSLVMGSVMFTWLTDKLKTRMEQDRVIWFIGGQLFWLLLYVIGRIVLSM